MQPHDEVPEDQARLESNLEQQEQKVGYGRPPFGARFRKGRSGNPKGRPKGAKNLQTLLWQALNISDLLEAGKAALGKPEDSTLVKSESIGRALRRFRQNDGNQRSCEMLRQSAQTICNDSKSAHPFRRRSQKPNRKFPHFEFLFLLQSGVNSRQRPRWFTRGMQAQVLSRSRYGSGQNSKRFDIIGVVYVSTRKLKAKPTNSRVHTDKQIRHGGGCHYGLLRSQDIVVDPFLGSGTSVIAAERTGRICYGIELDPTYVDVVIRRWQVFTRLSAKHSSSGRTFDELEKAVNDGRRQ